MAPKKKAEGAAKPAHDNIDRGKVYSWASDEKAIRSFIDSGLLKGQNVEVWDGKKWQKGTITSTNKSKNQIIFEEEAGERKAKPEPRPIPAKEAKFKLRELLSVTYSGRVFCFTGERDRPETVSDGSITCELYFKDEKASQVDLNSTKTRFFKERRVAMQDIYKPSYSVPASEKKDLADLEAEAAATAQLLKAQSDSENAKFSAKLAEEISMLDLEANSMLSPLQADLSEKLLTLESHRVSGSALLDASEEAGALGNASIRIQRKRFDESIRAMHQHTITPLERRIAEITNELVKRRKQAEKRVRDAAAELSAREEDSAAGYLIRAEAMRQKWQRLQEEDEALMRESLNFRLEHEWVAVRTFDKSRLGKNLEICSLCRIDPGYPNQENRCDTCEKFIVHEPRILELGLKPTWCKSPTLNSYAVFYNERSKAIRAAKPNLDGPVIAQMCKEEWKKMTLDEQGKWERRRQEVLLEITSHLHEHAADDDVPMLAGPENTEPCIKCLSARDTDRLLCCDRTEGSRCPSMIHLECLSPPLTAVPEGHWYCSELCRIVESRKPPAPVVVGPVRGKQAAGHASAVVVTSADVLDDDDGSDAGAKLAAKREVRADILAAKHRRLSFILSVWPTMSYFHSDPEKQHLGIVRKKEALEATNPATVFAWSSLLAPRLGLSAAHPILTATPRVVRGEMRSYQLEGLSWLIHQHDRGANSIIADEMGLGKTLQTLSFLAVLNSALPFFAPYLVVCPLSVLPTWTSEAKRWVPGLASAALYGPVSERERQKAAFIVNGQPTFSVLFTTYETLVQEQSWLSSCCHFRYLILDEAQKIKSEDSLVAKAVRNVRSVYRLLLTGTPLQNNLRELWSLLNFIYPEVFNEHCRSVFEQAFQLPSDSGGTVRDETFFAHANALLAPIMLRRLKANVLAGLLPPKTEIVLHAPLSPVQRYHYRQILLTDAGQARNDMQYRGLSALLMQLWKCCLHPFLFEGVEDVLLDEDGQAMHSVDERIVWSSGKLCYLDLILTRLFASKSKCLVYSQFTSMLSVLEEYCQWRGWKYLRLDGSTSLSRRRYYMYLFNRKTANWEDQHFVFLVSTKAGGVGINLQAANTVVLFDSSWNPFQDAQAEDRAHRMGQKDPVTIYRILTRNTCEERVRFFAQQKLALKDFILKDDVESTVLEATPEEGEEQMKQLYSDQQIVDMVRFGRDDILASEDVGERIGTKAAGEAFFEHCEAELSRQLNVKAGIDDKSPRVALAPITKNISIRRYDDQDFSRGVRATETDWIEAVDAKGGVRQRKSVTMTVKEEGVGMIEVSRWSVEQEQKEQQQLAKEKARIEANKMEGSKRVRGHEETCAHCKDSVLKQIVTVTTEIDNSGRHVKRRRLEGSGYHQCPLCPVSLHAACLKLPSYGLADADKSAWARSGCPQHRCTVCRRSASNAGGLIFRCIDCLTALCYDCVEKYEMLPDVEFRDRHGRWEEQFGFTPPSTYEYMRCCDCCKKR